MNNVHVQLFADLRQFVGGAQSVDIEITAGNTIAGVIDRLRIPRDKVKIVFLNARSSTLSQPLQSGDRLSLFSAVGGG